METVSDAGAPLELSWVAFCLKEVEEEEVIGWEPIQKATLDKNSEGGG